ncbi:hypothetical protein [uncultured Bacteroides sp.]|uniref:hypothetical protein n=1 Tax=uncultured Bacteroides sp. TaxID=162156 RepID=UPI0025DD4F6F|nr:hypothetical protein [uncultured Bacteroides sp.]
MRKNVFILFFLFAANVLPAQTVLDTLCAGPDSEEYDHYCKQHRILEKNRILRSGPSFVSQWWGYFRDSTFTAPLNVLFFRMFDWTKEKPLDGWYIITDQSLTSVWGKREVGFHPIESYVMEKVRAYADMEREIFACFTKGLPCCTWHYIYRKYGNVNRREFVTRGNRRGYGGELIDSLFKSVNYDNGLLHGDYTVYKGADTIYHTTFHQGTGHYKDFYVDGQVMIEGDIVNGCRDGVWVYYFYKEDKKLYRNVMLEHYERSKPYPVQRPDNTKHYRFITDSLVQEALRWEMETPKRIKRKKRNPIYDSL